MKATLEFDLPEERDEFEITTKAIDYRNVIVELNEWLRREIKYNDKNEYEIVRERLWNLLKDYEISLESWRDNEVYESCRSCTR
jgi:hypothetical protein